MNNKAINKKLLQEMITDSIKMNQPVGIHELLNTKVPKENKNESIDFLINYMEQQRNTKLEEESLARWTYEDEEIFESLKNHLFENAGFNRILDEQLKSDISECLKIAYRKGKDSNYNK